MYSNHILLNLNNKHSTHLTSTYFTKYVAN